MVAVAFNLDEEEIDDERDPLECECGRPKGPVAEACDRCRFLDGIRMQALIIDAMRGTDGLSISEVCQSLGFHYTRSGGGQARSVHRALTQMLRTGRVRKYWRELDAHIIQRQLFGRGEKRPMPVGSSGCWVYALFADGRER